MSHSEIDNTLSGVIVILLLFVMWGWHSGKSSCGEARIRMDCRCRPGSCRCRGYSRIPRNVVQPVAQPDVQPDVQVDQPADVSKPVEKLDQKETFDVENDLARQVHGYAHVTESGPTPNPADFATDDYESTTIDMALESGVEESHKRYCNSLSFAGLPTGSSSCTTLEETGRSYGTADFVGLTARKFCKARQLATPADDVRTTPSQSIVEWCDINMDDLI